MYAIVRMKTIEEGKGSKKLVVNHWDNKWQLLMYIIIMVERIPDR